MRPDTMIIYQGVDSFKGAGSCWANIDWEKGRMTVRSKKTEHHEGKASREVPIFPELRPFLEEAWEQAQVGQEYVITRYRGNVNLRTQLQRIIKRAGVAPWPKLWQNLRASRACPSVSWTRCVSLPGALGSNGPEALLAGDRRGLQKNNAEYDAAGARTG